MSRLEGPYAGSKDKAGLRSRRELGGIPPAVTFVFDKQGVVRNRFESNVRFGNMDEALEVVKTLRCAAHTLSLVSWLGRLIVVVPRL